MAGLPLRALLAAMLVLAGGLSAQAAMSRPAPTLEAAAQLRHLGLRARPLCLRRHLLERGRHRSERRDDDRGGRAHADGRPKQAAMCRMRW